MPNWCMNNLVIEGPDSEVNRFVDAAGDEGQNLVLNNLYPMPEDPAVQREQSEGCFLHELRAELDERFGRESKPVSDDQVWYDWRVHNWGTKWDIDRAELNDLGPGEVGYVFDSAWSPPEAWLEKVCADFPKLRFRLEYYELGCDFAGVMECCNGEVDFRASGRPEEFEHCREVLEEMKEWEEE